jgi:DnaK suppressor protein
MADKRTESREERLPLWRARELLEAKRARLVQRLGQDWQQAYDVADRPPLDEGERSSHEQLASVAHGRSTSELQQLREIDEALNRIHEGEYGICESCEEPIDPARLAAIPETRLCIACAEEEASARGPRMAPPSPVGMHGGVPLRGRLDPDEDHFGSRALDEATQNDPSPQSEDDDEESAEEAAVFPEPDTEERPEP